MPGVFLCRGGDDLDGTWAFRLWSCCHRAVVTELLPKWQMMGRRAYPGRWGRRIGYKYIGYGIGGTDREVFLTEGCQTARPMLDCCPNCNQTFIAVMTVMLNYR
jgi:hypothetical protein